MKCDIELEIIDSNIHFVEKNVPQFEQPRMPSIEELKQLVDVQDDLKDQHEFGSENVNEYLHAKIPCTMKFDAIKKQYYDNVIKDLESVHIGNNFTFTEILPNGKLAIPTDSDTEDEKEISNYTNNIDSETMFLEKKMYDKYNLQLSQTEKESIFKSNTMKKVRSKIQLERNAKGQFIKRNALSINIEKNDDDFLSDTENINFHNSIQTNVANEIYSNVKNSEEELFLPECISINDINIDNIDLKSDTFNINDYLNLSDITFFNDIDKKESIAHKKYQFFRPFKDYWMYHCIFSRVKSKNFTLFEKVLPRTFRWLLNECALIVEMSTEDLYEEICLIESYHSYVLKSCTFKNNNCNNVDTISKSQLNFILNKW